MDFFERQDKARRNTKFLVFYFLAAVVLLIVAVYAAVALIFTFTEESFSWAQPGLFFGTAVATLAVISIGSVGKTMSLSSGGRAVAELLDGRLVN
ncbi:MAG TPA: hypothetical protein VF626_00535, partial [Chthoniobacterales bacterium]